MIYMATPEYTLGSERSISKSERTIDIQLEALAMNRKLVAGLGIYAGRDDDSVTKQIQHLKNYLISFNIEKKQSKLIEMSKFPVIRILVTDATLQSQLTELI